MSKDSSFVRTILFNVLVILTIVFIYFMFFPKKSYVKNKLDEELNPLIDEVFSQNMNSLTIAGESYFSADMSSSFYHQACNITIQCNHVCKLNSFYVIIHYVKNRTKNVIKTQCT